MTQTASEPKESEAVCAKKAVYAERK